MTDGAAMRADDIDYIRSLAEEGATAPNIGGRFYVWWSALIIVALLLHWATLIGWTPWSPAQVGFVWLGYLTIGLAGTFALSSGLSAKPGFHANNNRASAAFWSLAGLGMGGVIAAILVAVMLRDAPVLLFDLLPALGLLLYAAGLGVEAKLERAPWKLRTAYAGVIASTATFALVGAPEAYLVAAAGYCVVGLIPGVSMMRGEPNKVV